MILVTCTCSSLVNGIFGNCKKNYLGGPICYVNHPSNCTDKEYNTTASAFFSWEACGKYNLIIRYII